MPKNNRSVTRFTLCPFGNGFKIRAAPVTARAGTDRKEAIIDVAGLAPRPRDAAVRARVSKTRDRRLMLPDLIMLNLEDLRMSQIEPRRRPLAAIAAPASDGPVVASQIENRADGSNE